MSELPRRIVSRLRRFIGNRRRSKRAQARLNFNLSLGDPRVNSNGSRRLPSLKGHTLDVSVTGLALVVPAIRIGEHYVAGVERRLHLNLELPTGPVQMTVAPVRYESLEEDANESGYVVGVRIMEMSDSDRAKFADYLKRLLHHRPLD
ncbi:MAG TPA: PilZ domain-containing protein [Pyrinomonadaceae bacterium]|nr:PilZ domain-containing protein [Pyrinomonadaceae bacterium]